LTSILEVHITFGIKGANLWTIPPAQ